MRLVLSLVGILSVAACGSVSRPGDGDGDAGGDHRSDGGEGDLDGAGGSDDAAVAAYTSCSDIHAAEPDANDGTYTIERDGVDIEVWCIMSGSGVTYEALGFGAVSSAYNEYVGATEANLANARVQKAYIWLYNRQNGAINLSPGWNSGNCCFKGYNSNPGAVLTFGGNYLFPGEVGDPITTNCSGGYSSERYKFTMQNDAAEFLPPDPLPSDFFASYPVSGATTCNDDNNPGWFFKRY